MVFLVPKPRLGNALAGEAPRLPVTGDGPKPGLRAQMRSQAGAWERGNKSELGFGFPGKAWAFYLLNRL
jgi:hypothetical protein